MHAIVNILVVPTAIVVGTLIATAIAYVCCVTIVRLLPTGDQTAVHRSKTAVIGAVITLGLMLPSLAFAGGSNYDETSDSWVGPIVFLGIIGTLAVLGHHLSKKE